MLVLEVADGIVSGRIASSPLSRQATSVARLLSSVVEKDVVDVGCGCVFVAAADVT